MVWVKCKNEKLENMQTQEEKNLESPVLELLELKSTLDEILSMRTLA